MVDGAYDGGNIIHIFASDMSGTLRDYPFDTSTNTFKPAKTISTGNPTPGSATDIGTAGVSSMFDKSNTLHLAYWAPGNQIIYRSYTYNTSTDSLTLTSGPTRLDSSGNANHPEIAISPLDNSVTVAWVNGTSGAGTISARTRPAGGAWGSIEAASSGAVWTSPNSGINIDQGPSMVIASDGMKAFTYIENFGSCGSDYGRLHFVSKTAVASSWTDQTLNNFCTHANGLAIDNSNNFYAISHGHPANPTCIQMTQVCSVQRNSNGTWNNPVVFANPPAGDSFDNSVSPKWSVVGWNNPETIEFALFDAIGGSYTNTDLWYGRLATTGSTASPSPVSSSQPSPSPSPVSSPSPSPSPSAGTGSGSFQINSGSNDVNEDGTSFDASSTTVFLGTGGVVGGGYTGLRFTGVNIPFGATITSAHLEVVSPSATWNQLDFGIYGEKVANSAVFSTSSRPSGRSLTTATIVHSDNLNWAAGATISLNEMASVIQEIVNTSGWVSGNSLSVILKGTGTAFNRKFVSSFEGSAGSAPKLVVNYTTPAASPSPSPSAAVSPSPSPSPTPTPKPGDINGDGAVGLFDFSIMLTKWGGTDTGSDLNGDGIVGLFDFSLLLTYWGS